MTKQKRADCCFVRASLLSIYLLAKVYRFQAEKFSSLSQFFLNPQKLVVLSDTVGA